MTPIDRIRIECKKKGVAISRLEKSCGFANGYIRNLREGKMPADRLQKIADYLGVSYKYLLTGEQEEINAAALFSGPDAILEPALDMEKFNEIFKAAYAEATTGAYRLAPDEKKIILAYRIAPESTKDIIRKILDVGAAEGSESLTEAG